MDTNASGTREEDIEMKEEKKDEGEVKEEKKDQVIFKTF